MTIFYDNTGNNNYAGCQGTSGGFGMDDVRWRGPSRSTGTNYQNTQSHPIQVGIAMFRNQCVWIGSTTSNKRRVANVGGDYSEGLNAFIIPPGHYYCANGNRRWRELY